jgi:glycosyltransferase involved in cell wall biosynthesis
MLDSIQYDSSFEIVVCDDGSTDKTKQMVLSFRDKLNIKYVYQKNLGVSAAILKAYNNSSGKYLIKMDSDDYFTNRGLDFILKSIKKNQKYEAFLYGVSTIKGNKYSKNLPPNGITNFISVRADLKVRGDLKEVVRRDIILKNIYKVPKKVKRIPPGLLWFKIAENYNCLSFHKVVAIKSYLEEGITSKILSLKTSHPNQEFHLPSIWKHQ